MMCIEVAYALPQRQWLESLQVADGCSLLQALAQSGLAQAEPQLLPWDACTLGVWGEVERSPATRILQDGDRIEVYRALLNDPKEARQARARRARAARAQAQGR